jgi:hypothetical protein
MVRTYSATRRDPPLNLFIFIFLFNDAISMADYKASSGRMNSE